MLAVAAYLTGGLRNDGCGHSHAIAVFPGDNQVWVSQLAVTCLEGMPL